MNPQDGSERPTPDGGSSGPLAAGSLRLFVALPVDEDVRTRLVDAVGHVREETPGWRWTRPEGWHVTLAFLGEVDGRRLDDVARAVGAATTGRGPVVLRLGRPGHFGRGVLHVAVEDEPTGAVADLGGRVQEALAEADLPVRPRAVRPHLTLARARRRARPQVPPLAVPQGAWTVDAVRLYASRLGPGGSVYEELERLPLS